MSYCSFFCFTVLQRLRCMEGFIAGIWALCFLTFQRLVMQWNSELCGWTLCSGYNAGTPERHWPKLKAHHMWRNAYPKSDTCLALVKLGITSAHLGLAETQHDHIGIQLHPFIPGPMDRAFTQRAGSLGEEQGSNPHLPEQYCNHQSDWGAKDSPSPSFWFV